MKDMKFLVSIYSDEDGIFIAECPSIPGCVSQGRTEAEAEAKFAVAALTPGRPRNFRSTISGSSGVRKPVTSTVVVLMALTHF